MEIAAEETKKEYQNLRHQVVLEEEEEEQIIREQLTKRLQPYLDAMLYNANVTGRLDLLLEKLTATYFGKAVKPVFSGMIGMDVENMYKNTASDISFKLENVTNPWVASVLKNRGLEFTPLSIELTQGATVITGANMGGKSISLKTIVLNVVLAMCGFMYMQIMQRFRFLRISR